jgi:hypothetical protein
MKALMENQRTGRQAPALAAKHLFLICASARNIFLHIQT